MSEQLPSFDPRGSVPDELACVFFEDTSYWHNNDIEEASRIHKAAIEKEFGCKLSEVDIGPGFSVPAWLLEIDVRQFAATAAFVAIFFSGKNILSNLNAWTEIAKKIKELIYRKSCLNRTAAAALALDELFKMIGSPVSEVRLTKYSVFDRRYENFVDARPSDEGPRIEFSGFAVHIFDFVVDGRNYVAVVDGRDVGISHKDLTRDGLED